jgi:starch synthase
MKVLLAHPGTQHSRHLARELARRDLLSKFCTSLGFGDGIGGSLATALRKLPRLSGLGSRILSGVPASRISSRPMIELRALWKLRHGHDALSVFHERNQTFQKGISDRAIRQSDAVIGFDTSSWILARRCNAHEIPFYLDRTIAHRSALHRIMADFAMQYPDWQSSKMPDATFVADAEQEEYDRSKRIVVGGQFARDTLVNEGVDPGKVIVNPYGVNWNQFAEVCRTSTKRPFRFLFAGSVIARKGVPVLLDAWREIQPTDAELWIAGSIGSRERGLIPDLPGLKILGQIQHGQMASVYADCDVFVLPSLFEGFGLVILEALAAGLPVISTPHTGAIETIVNDRLGRIVPVAEVRPLVSAMQQYLDMRPERILVKDEAIKLKEKFSWEAYGDRWEKLLTDDLGAPAGC